MSQTSVVYLDNNATTRIAPEVVESMMPFLTDRYGNPSSIHRFGGSVKRHIDAAREKVAAMLNAHPEEIIFTGSGSESDNMALKGCAQALGPGTTLVTSAVEHPAVLNTCRALAATKNLRLVEVGVDGEGLLRNDQLEALSIDEHTIVSLMWANNETGVLFDIQQLSEYVGSRGGIFHSDAVQAAGKVHIDVQKTPVNLLSLSGHKLHAPKGIGALYVRKGTPIAPLIHGGHQELGMRAGTENVASIVGLGVACELTMRELTGEIARIKDLRDRLETTILAAVPGSKRNGHRFHRLPNTTNISFEFIEGEAILLLLDEKGICASSGSACTTGSLEPSHVMKAMGIPYTMAHSSIRFSLSRYTTDADIDAVIEALPPIVQKLRELSPYVK